MRFTFLSSYFQRLQRVKLFPSWGRLKSAVRRAKMRQRFILGERLEDRTLLAADFAGVDDGWGLLSGHGGNCNCPICTGQGLDAIPLAAEVDASGLAQSPLSDLAQAPLSSLPQLSSDVSASAKLFLDFDGHFEATWGSRTNADTPAFDQDGDATTFSAGELTAINEIWARVAEDFAPFRIDVTTVDPGNQSNGVTAVIAIGGQWQDWYGNSAGGVAYIGGFYNLSPNVGYVFAANLGGNVKNIAEASSHEAGHLFGLQHQALWSGSTLVTEYNTGNGTWAPLMGIGYGATRTTWYNGPTIAGPTAFQDDMSVLSGPFNGFGFRADNYGGTIATAGSLPVIGTSVNFSGLIEQANDLDVWSFTTGGGTVTFQLTGAQYGSNLDAVLELRNASGATILSDSPSNSLGASLTTVVGPGTYYLVARSVGDYGNVGKYTIIGSLPETPASPPIVQFSVTSFSANENDGTTHAIILSRNGDLTSASQVQVSIVGGTATPGSDYGASSFPLTINFAAGESSQTVPVTLLDDSRVEGLETVIFQVSSHTNAVIGTRIETTLNLADGDFATVAFQSAATTVGEDDATTSLVLVLSTAPGNTLENGATITLTATNGSAENADYNWSAFPRTVTFIAGQGNGATQTVGFAPASDTLVEGDETVTLAIANGPLLTGSGQTSHLVSIQDGDSATISFQSSATTVGEDDAAAALVLVLSTAPGNTLEQNATLTLTATNGSAENADYDSGTFPKTVTFTAGQGNGATQTVGFAPTSDTLVEGDETVTLAIANGPLLTGSGQTSHLVTIQDADFATASFQSPATTVGEDDAAAALVLVLSTAPGNTLEQSATITISATNGTAQNADYDSGVFPQTVTFTAGQGNGATQTVGFAPASDNLVEGGETVTLAIANGSLLSGSGQTSNLVTIQDEDSATILVVPGQSVTEDGGAQDIAVRLLMTGGRTLERAMTVALSAAPSAGTEAADATFGVLGSFSFAASAGNNTTSTAVSFAPNSDTLVEGTEMALLTPSGSTLNGQVTYISNNIAILDGDSATISFQSLATTAEEDDAAAALVLVLSTAPGNTLENSATLTLTATNGSAENADYDSGTFPKAVTFTAGQGNGATQTVGFAPTSDTLVEGDEAVTLAIANGPLLTGSGQTSHLVTIQDADFATVSFQSSSTTVGEDEAAAALVLVLSTAPGNTLESGATITITATNGTAQNADYDSGAFPKTVTFTAGQGNGATQAVGFAAASDTLVEGDETVTLAIANGSLLSGSGQTSNLVTIQDADFATVAFQSASTAIGEDDLAMPIVLVLSTAPGNTLENGASITITATNGSAENADYNWSAFPRTVTFIAGQGNGATQTVEFAPASDTLVEGDETVTLAIANGSLLTGSGQTSHLVSIQDGDSATISFQSSATTVGEDDAAAALVLVLSTAPGNTLEQNATVTLTATNGSAENADYDSGTFPKTVTFTAGQGNGATQTVGFAPTSDNLVEGDETVTLAIANGPLLTGSGQTSHLVTIQDADFATASFQSPATTVGEDDAAAALVLVLSTTPGNTLEQSATITISATNGTAQNADYGSGVFPQTVTFTAGQGNGATQTVGFAPASDNLVEGGETVTLAIANGSLLSGSGQTSNLVTIQDEDSATILVVPGQSVTEDGGSQEIAVRLLMTGGRTLERAMTVALSAAPSAGTEAADATFGVLGSFSFAASAGNNTTSTAVSFAPNSDTLVEGTEMALLTPSGSTLNGQVTYISNNIAILDGDSATISFQSLATTVGEDDAAAALVLVLSTAPGNTLENGATLTLTATNGSAENADYDSGTFPKTVTFTAGQGNGATQTVGFAPTSDTLVEGDETVTLAIANGSLLTGSGQTSHLVTIQDADFATVSFQSSSTTAGEDEAAAALVLVLSTAPGNTLESGATITITATNGTAQNADYDSGAFPKTVTFTAGQGNGATQAVGFAAASDTLVEGDETVTLAIANGSLLSGSGQTSNLVTIQDADFATVTFQSASTAIDEDDLATPIVLVLSTAPGNTLENGASITITATNGSAENADYNWSAFPKTVTFTAGQGNGATQTVEFAPASDTLVEGDESVTLAIANGSLLIGSGQTSHLVTIQDEDSALVLVVPGQSVTEDGGAQEIAVRLLMTDGRTLERAMTVALSAAPSAGTEADDATFGVLGSFSFAASAGNNTTSTMVSFAPNSDTLVEGTEMALLTPSGSTLDGQVTYLDNEVAILDGDFATVSFQSTSTAISEDGPAPSIVMVLSTAFGNTLEHSATITINAINGSGENPDYDSIAFPKSAVFMAGQGNGATETVSFDPTSDTLIEGDETVALSISSGFLLTENGQTTHLITILDGPVVTDEDLPVSINLEAGDLGDQPSYQMQSWPLHGTLSGTFPNLRYSPAANFSGTDSFLVKVNDGLPNSNEATIRMVVRPVNDEPSFTMPLEIGVTDESPAQTISNWAHNIAAGPPGALDEFGQTVSFSLTDDNQDLFKERPTIDDTGTLRFTPNPNVNGRAEVTVVLKDDSGTDHGGQDTSPTLSFTIYVAKARVWHNAKIRWDVTDDGEIIADDVLSIINLINASGSQPVPPSNSAAGPYFDVTGDGWVVADDVLDVINRINALRGPDSLTANSPDIGFTATSAAHQPSTEELISLIALDLVAIPKRRQ